ncbi:hypothetical protein MAM1_0325d09684 [Mucor ambiguus]|uniref:Uncharacterized protein n=1 Tax=Mucor ambiguus TaxID=91626 RepID=A0A0C9N288_9FUNG|nr:hypothetical protein MAM1_0325d09684 [Mucor ambiguus]
MWKRERMMVDVISIKPAAQLPPSSACQHSPSLLINNNHGNLPPPPPLPLLQNRQCYPFDSHIHDDINNFYAGNEYNQFGDIKSPSTKRRLSIHENMPPKRQKPLKALPPTTSASTSTSQPKSSYTFTSKPHDCMDNNIMYDY